MEIKFKSINVDGETIAWVFANIDELDQAYWSEDADVPSNDDIISDITFNDEAIGISALLGGEAIFSDLVVLLGIDVAH